MRLYRQDLDPRELEPFYSRHVNAMTEEELYEKSDIALQLASRDRALAAWELLAANNHDHYSMPTLENGMYVVLFGPHSEKVIEATSANDAAIALCALLGWRLR